MQLLAFVLFQFDRRLEHVNLINQLSLFWCRQHILLIYIIMILSVHVNMLVTVCIEVAVSCFIQMFVCLSSYTASKGRPRISDVHLLSGISGLI